MKQSAAASYASPWLLPWLLWLLALVPLALASRRLRDIGKSGWWLILPLGGLILGFLILFSAEAYYESPWLLWLLALVPLALASKRLHDIGKSGWWQLLPLGGFILVFLILFSAGAYFESLWPMSLMELLVSLVLFLGSIVLLIVWLAKKGDEGPNKYGPDPRQATSQQP